MRPFLFLISTLFITAAKAQTILGTVTNANKQALAYVNIGIVGKGIGTVSDINGNFSINLPDSLNEQLLKFSYIGYKSQSFTVNDFKKKLKNNHVSISMEESSVSLAEIIIKPKTLKRKILGNTNSNPAMRAGFVSNDLGSEMGTIMRIKRKPTHIENVNFNIASNEIGSVKFRMNIYAMKNGQPDSIILKEPIYITTSIKSGTLSVDLEEHNLWVESDFMISLEWIEDYGVNKLTFCVGLMDSNSLWRKTSQDKWQKATPVGIGINTTVTYEK